MQIERNIITELLKWKESPFRKPLLLKGVRQCGKTWILKHFGKKYFTKTVDLNFDKDSELASFFTGTYDPKKIIVQLSAYCGQKITPHDTLIIFDEIQACPNALNALISAPNAVDCSGAACEASYRQKMDELLKTHAAEIKDDPNTDREALLVAFGELKNTIQQSSNKLNAQFPQKAPNGVYQSVTNYLNP